MIDQLGLFTFETFASARESVMMSKTEQLLELSTPVVKLWDGVLAVPFVDTLDSARTQVVMETLLQTLVDTGSAHAIIDITGVAAVDTQVAQHLFSTTTVFSAMTPGASGAVRLIEHLVVRETYLFREFDQLRSLVRRWIVPRVAGNEKMRIWSAACSTGDEPLSLAVLLAEAGVIDKVEIVASDLSLRALEIAQKGRFVRRSLRALPPESSGDSCAVPTTVPSRSIHVWWRK